MAAVIAFELQSADLVIQEQMINDREDSFDGLGKSSNRIIVIHVKLHHLHGWFRGEARHSGVGKEDSSAIMTLDDVANGKDHGR